MKIDGPEASGGGAPISLATMPNYGFTVTIAFIKGAAGSFQFDAAQLLPQALAAGRVSYWRQGPIVTEGRIEVPVAASMRLVFDISKYQDGTYSTEVQFNNDLAMTAVGGKDLKKSGAMVAPMSLR